MFPIRFVAESFGFDVTWDEQNRIVTIGYNGQTMKNSATLLYQG
ncbi:stalk domain-containing protein [Acetivibrio sp. MSJd-27]